MRLFGRRDSILIIGLTVALGVIFARPIGRLLDIAREVEQASGLALIPALIILLVVFLLHQQAKRQEVKAEAIAAAAAAQESEARARDLERLVAFEQALARSLDLDAIREAVLQHLPSLAATPAVWVLMRSDGVWQSLIGSTREGRREVDAARERMADQALAVESDRRLSPGGIEWEGQLCFPMVAGGATLGVLGLPESAPLNDSQRRMLAAASALLAMSIRTAQLFREVRENSVRDGLTGCYNRTHALEVIDTELRRARRSQSPIALIMFDLDRFKDVNDRYGHLCGDAVLATVGRRMKEVLRGSDLKCRYGGEEFLVLLPETPLDGGTRVAEALRRDIADASIHWGTDTLAITASFGVTVALPNEVNTAALLARVDAALYRAKDEGRNCVRIAADGVMP